MGPLRYDPRDMAERSKPLSLIFFARPVFTTVSIQKASDARVRRILVWLVLIQTIAGSVPVHRVSGRLLASPSINCPQWQRLCVPQPSLSGSQSHSSL
jgi:hypothetical protein